MPGFALPWSRAFRVHEDIKLGAPGAIGLIDPLLRQHREYGRAPHSRVVLQLHAVFDWTRTDLAMRLPDGSTALAYDDRALAGHRLSRGTGELRGGPPRTQPADLRCCSPPTGDVDAEHLWDNLA